MRHCADAYATAHADPLETTFTVVREVVSRAVSSYNFRNARNPAKHNCTTPREVAHLEGWIDSVLLHRHANGMGDIDNHDVPQALLRRYG